LCGDSNIFAGRGFIRAAKKCKTKAPLATACSSLRCHAGKGQRLKPDLFQMHYGTAEQAAKKVPHHSVILSEAKNLSWVLFLYSNQREILRFAQNDRATHFFR
jgi:hypothetical protein